MAAPKFKTAGKTATSLVENRHRKEIFANVEPVCWIKDYEKEIDVNANGRYHNRYDLTGRLQDENDPVKYKVHIPAKSQTPVVIEVRYFFVSLLTPDQERTVTEKIAAKKMAPKYGGPKGYIVAVKEVCETAIKLMLNGKLLIKISDPDCGERTFKLEFKVTWSESEESCHYRLKVHDTIERENVNGDVVSVALGTDRHTHAHEYLHCIGLPDEYSYHKSENELIRYYQPDGSLSQAIIGVPDLHEPAKESTSILNSSEAENLEPRHGFPVAYEIQKLWKAETGRDVVCKVLKS